MRQRGAGSIAVLHAHAGDHDEPAVRLDPKPRRRPEPLPGPRCPSGPTEVLDRHLHHLRPPPADEKTRDLTKHY